MMNLHIHTIVTGPVQENTFLIYKNSTAETIFVDPGDDAEKLIHYCDVHKLKPIAIINTHAHVDHISAVNPLKAHYSIPFYLHKDEKIVLDSYEIQCRMLGLPIDTAPIVDHWLQNENSLKIGEFSFRFIHTPGHTPGGICFLIEGHGFVGDTLFRGSVGRTDLPGGDWDTINQSLIKMMETIPQDWILHPGHGLDTTLKVELNENPFLIPLKKRVNLP